MKTEYYKITIDGSFCLFSSLSDACESLKYDVQSFLDSGAGDPVEVTFELVELTQEEIDALPDFEGW